MLALARGKVSCAVSSPFTFPSGMSCCTLIVLSQGSAPHHAEEP